MTWPSVTANEHAVPPRKNANITSLLCITKNMRCGNFPYGLGFFMAMFFFVFGTFFGKITNAEAYNKKGEPGVSSNMTM
jgi:hypothetical protein